MPITSNALDALLAIRNGSATARWNFPDAVGSQVSAPAGIGDAVTISYSFLASRPAYSTSTGDGVGFTPFDAQQVQAARQVIALIEQVARVDFVEVAGVGQVTFGNSTQPAGQGAYANYPSYGYTYSPATGTILSTSENNAAGDVWVNSQAGWAAGSWDAGGFGFETLLHELGHALGLKHPFEGTYLLDPALDNTASTVMSYTNAPNSAIVTVSGTSLSYSWVTSHVAPSTLMPFDIAALQALYGANTAFHTGNDTYRWGTSEEFFATLWDAGGTDTIDCSNQTLACRIDLNENTYSSIAVRSTDAELRQGLGLPTWFTQPLPADVYNGSNNLAIASGTVIENAIGGKGSDILGGNAFANSLTGGAGNDTLRGLAGNDVLNGGIGADRMEGGTGGDLFYVDNAADVVVEAAGAGADTVYSSLASLVLPANVENGRILLAGAANLAGNALNNVITAGAGNNVLAGDIGIDTLSYATAAAGVTLNLASTVAQATGGSGSDTISGFENLVGSRFDDTFTGTTDANTLNGGLGIDTVFYSNATSGVTASLATTTGLASGGGGADTLLGIENLTGSAYADSLTGSTGMNVLAGGAGNDTLSGGAGNDRLLGGAGQDRLTGGIGNDVFDFDLPAESGLTALTRDIILDFAPGVDRIDLFTLDADVVAPGDNAFTFIGTAAFSANASGQLRYVYNTATGSGLVYGSNDADIAPEFSIELVGVAALSATDFVA